MIDQELIFWDKATADASLGDSAIVDINPYRRGNPRPIQIYMYLKNVVFAAASVNIRMKTYLKTGVLTDIQYVFLLPEHVANQNQFVFTLPSWVRDRVYLSVQSASGFTAGTISAGINIDQQTNG